MAAPTITLRVDWANKGSFTGGYDRVTVIDEPGISISRGSSADLSSEASGTMTFDLDNDSHRYTPDRQWCDNPSFELGTDGWRTVAVTGLTAAATSISKVVDNAPSAGSSAGEAVLTATSGSGVYYKLPYLFRVNVPHSFSFYLKSMSGTTSVQCGIASSTVVADIATAGGTITGDWVQYSGTWTPTSDRGDDGDEAVLFVRTTTAAAATVRIDRVQLNTGSTLNGYLEAPSRGELLPGRPVHFYGTLAAADTAKFYGYIDRITPNPANSRVTVSCVDSLDRMESTSVVVPANSYCERSARSLRLWALEDFERGNLNLLTNSSFESDTAGWTATAGVLTRRTTDNAPDAGSAYMEFNPAAAGNQARAYPYLSPIYMATQAYCFSVWLKNDTGNNNVVIGIGTDFGAGAANTERTVGTNETWQRFSVVYTLPATVTASGATPLAVWIESSDAGNNTRIDAAMVTRGSELHGYADEGTGRFPNFVGNGDFEGGGTKSLTLQGWADAFAGPGGGGGTGVSSTSMSTTAKYGARSHQWGSAASTGSGRVYDFNHYGPVFVASEPYTASVWIRPSSNMPYLVGIGADKGGGLWDEASTSGTATANTWTQVTVPWTPSADRSSSVALGVVLYVWQTDATARTVRIDGVRVIPGSTADDFEMAQWDVAVGAEADDLYLTTAALEGDALEVLGKLNALEFTRHFIRPIVADPFYQYVTIDRETFDAGAYGSVATYTEDIQGWDDLDLDDEAVINVVEITHAGGTEYYSDGDSIDRHGERAGTVIDGAAFFPNRTIPDEVGPAILDRYKRVVLRPTMTIEQQYAAQLAIDLQQVITATIAMFLLNAQEFVVLREDLAITNAGQSWVSTLALETYPF